MYIILNYIFDIVFINSVILGRPEIKCLKQKNTNFCKQVQNIEKKLKGVAYVNISRRISIYLNSVISSIVLRFV